MANSRQNLIELRISNLKLQSLSGKYKDVKAAHDKQEKEIDRLESELQTKAHGTPVYAAAATPKPPSGSCVDWIKTAGVTDIANAHALIMRESGCNPTIYNRGGSGACGIPQALPCSKLPQGINTSPVDQIKWMDNYCKSRYGSWAAANNFQLSNGWY